MTLLKASLAVLALLACSYSYSEEGYPYNQGLPPGVVEHNISDDGNVHIPLQFPFPYYGRTFTDSWMFSNGVVGFLAPGASFCCTGMDLNDPRNHNPVWSFSLMPLWTDLRNYNGRFLTEGTPDYQRYVWENISEFGRPGSENTFGVEIFPSGNWQFFHEKIDINRPFTIGATGDLSQGEYQQFQYFPNGLTLQDYDWDPSYIGDPNPISICDSDPLADPSCPGYADAYYEQQCSFDPLYDPTCSGYDQAYLELQCSYDPLYDTTCEGYADAYYNQQCGLDPLYDVGCDGYAEAYYDQQCSLDPLYDSTCPGYEQAYYDQQCSISPLYDEGCFGYEQAYYDQQCSLDPLYDVGCNGYNDAYYALQCELDALYDTQCPGYAEAVAETYVKEEPVETVAIPETAPEPAEVPITGDVIVDSVLKETENEITQTIPEPAPEPEPVEETRRSDDEPSDEPEGEVADGGDSEAEEKDEDREELKKKVAKKASQLAERMSEAATLEAQQAAQEQVLSLLSYVPDFNQYQVMMNGGYYPDAQFYQDEQLPESRKGLRNGLAQQLLHEQMIDMQYDKE